MILSAALLLLGSWLLGVWHGRRLSAAARACAERAWRYAWKRDERIDQLKARCRRLRSHARYHREAQADYYARWKTRDGVLRRMKAERAVRAARRYHHA